ncbi:cytochrome c oxidase subunit 4 [Brachybacterium sp. AOP25-B2-12]|uniref:cytochrome c oxidase subunit 4 n=1 Tax=Brachybacterium sp. AOP25-B2-12 TaxID=3457710 RepID=UPI0040339A43
MRSTSRIFGILFLFFVIVGVVYGILGAMYAPMGIEPVGFAAILMGGGMALMIAAVTALNARSHKDRPEDDENAPVSADAGIQGSFAPYSWWPLYTAIACALVFLGVAAGFWISALGVVVAIYGITGWVMEFSRGQHAH